MKLSPKVYIPTILALAACLALKLLTGDDTYLVAALISLAAGGTGAVAPPTQTPGVTQADVEEVAPHINIRRARK